MLGDGRQEAQNFLASELPAWDTSHPFSVSSALSLRTPKMSCSIGQAQQTMVGRERLCHLEQTSP